LTFRVEVAVKLHFIANALDAASPIFNLIIEDILGRGCVLDDA